MADSATFNGRAPGDTHQGIYVLTQDGENHFAVTAMTLAPDHENGFKSLVSNFADPIDSAKVMDAINKGMSDVDSRFVNPNATFVTAPAVMDAVAHSYESALGDAVDAYNAVSSEYDHKPTEIEIVGDVYKDNTDVVRQRVDVDMMISPMLDLARLSPPAGAGEDFNEKVADLEAAQLRLDEIGGFVQETIFVQQEHVVPEGVPALDWSQFEYDAHGSDPAMEMKVR